MEEKPVKTEQRLEGGGPQLLGEAGGTWSLWRELSPATPGLQTPPSSTGREGIPVVSGPSLGYLSFSTQGTHKPTSGRGRRRARPR